MSVVWVACGVFVVSSSSAQAGLRLKQKDAQRVELKYCGGTFSVYRKHDGRLYFEADRITQCSQIDIDGVKKTELKQNELNEIRLSERSIQEIRLYSKSGKTWDDFVIEIEQQTPPPTRSTQTFTCQCATADGLYFPTPVTVEALNLNNAVDTMLDACANPLVKLGYRGDLRAASAACR